MSESENEGRKDRQAPFQKGATVTVRIASLAAGGDGVARDFGMPVFVSRTAPGDLAEVQVFDVRKDFAFGQLVSLKEPSPVRGEPPCKLFKVCGGCQWQHLQYQGQLEAKADILRQAVKHIAQLSPDLVSPALPAADPLYYRNKVQFPVESVKGSDRLKAGYYKQNSHELVNIKHCPIQPAALDRMLEAVKAACEAEKVNAYDEGAHRGLLRHIAARYSTAHDEVLLTLVINAHAPLSPSLQEKLERVAAAIMSEASEVKGVCLNFNDARGNRIMGDTTICLAGKDKITEVLRSGLAFAREKNGEGVEFELSSTSFFQVNSRQAEVLLDQVLLAAAGVEDGASAPPPVPLLVDAYAGVGTMSLWLASAAQRIIAIEEWPDAVRDGKNNCALNGVGNVEFRQGSVEDEVPILLQQRLKPDVVVVDPPRKGLDPRALKSLCQLEAKRFVYVSCNPTTLARDLKILESSGYKTKRIQPVDMFPQTYHIESVTVLERQVGGGLDGTS